MLVEWLLRVEGLEGVARALWQARALGRERKGRCKGRRKRRPAAGHPKEGWSIGGDASWRESGFANIGGDNEALGIDLDLEMKLLTALNVDPVQLVGNKKREHVAACFHGNKTSDIRGYL